MAKDSLLARKITQDIISKTRHPPVFVDGRLWVFSPTSGCFFPKSMRTLIQTYHKTSSPISDATTRGTVNILVDICSDPDFFSSAPAASVATNLGVFSNGTFYPPSPDSHEFRANLYLPNVKQEPLSALNDFFISVWPENYEGNTALVLQFFGVSLLGLATHFEQCLLFYGQSGRNGKSILMDVLEAATPQIFRSSVAPAEWHREYYRARLAGSLLNLVPELPDTHILDNADFKSIISGNMKTARNPTQQPFDFRPRAGHIFNTNTLPSASNPEEAFFRRWLLVEFPVTFPPSDRKKLLAPLLAEIPQLLYHSLMSGYDALLLGHYQTPKASEALLDHWKQKADPIRAFSLHLASDFDIPASASKHRLSVQETYKIYRDWCSQNGHYPLSLPKFSDRFKNFVSKQRGDTGFTFDLSRKAR